MKKIFVAFALAFTIAGASFLSSATPASAGYTNYVVTNFNRIEGIQRQNPTWYQVANYTAIAATFVASAFFPPALPFAAATVIGLNAPYYGASFW